MPIEHFHEFVQGYFLNLWKCGKAIRVNDPVAESNVRTARKNGEFEEVRNGDPCDNSGEKWHQRGGPLKVTSTSVWSTNQAIFPYFILDPLG